PEAMTVMVDELRPWPTKVRCFKAGSCHLTATSLDELHAFAKRLGLKREWFQDHVLAPHYDLTVKMRAKALSMGAIMVPAREQARQRRAAKVARLVEVCAPPSNSEGKER